MVYGTKLSNFRRPTNCNWKFAFYVKTRTLFYPFVPGYYAIPVFVRACVPMADYLNNTRVFVHQLVNKFGQRHFLFRGPCIGRVSGRIQAAHVTNPDGMFVVCHAGQSGRVAMCAVPVQRAAHLNGSVQVNDVIIPNHCKATFFVPFINVGGADVLTGPRGRTMDYNCINFVHRLFRLGPCNRNACNAFSNVHRLQRQQDIQHWGPYICVCKNAIA